MPFRTYKNTIIRIEKRTIKNNKDNTNTNAVMITTFINNNNSTNGKVSSQWGCLAVKKSCEALDKLQKAKPRAPKHVARALWKGLGFRV